MYKITNLSTTDISIDGANLAPKQSKVIEQISYSLRWLANKKAVKISSVPNAIPVVKTEPKIDSAIKAEPQSVAAEPESKTEKVGFFEKRRGKPPKSEE